MEEYRQKYRQYLSKALEGVDTSDPSAVEAAYVRLRAANERMLANNPRLAETGRDAEMRAAVEAVIAEHTEAARMAVEPAAAAAVSEPEPEAAVASSARPRGSKAMLATGVIAGLAIGAVTLLLLSSTGVMKVSTGAEAQRQAQWERDFEKSLPKLDASIEFLGKVEKEVQRRQKEAAADLAKVAGAKFVQLRAVDAKLAASAPKGMPQGTGILVRATDKGYKILYTGPLCRVASMARPDFVDPKDRNVGLECTRFGVWNAAGASF